jgi:hypothetical protein
MERGTVENGSAACDDTRPRSANQSMSTTTQAGKTVTTDDIERGDMIAFERDTHLGTQVFHRRAKATHGDEVHLVTTGIESIEDVVGVEKGE